MFTLHSHCRCCGYAEPKGPPGIKAPPSDEKLIRVLDLGFQPVPNNFVRENEEHEGFAKLQVDFCPRCTLAQLSLTVRPDLLYKQYAYTTSRSETMKCHFDSLWSYIRSECNPFSVVEIGSNDGFFLEYAKSRGADTVCGIDPSENLSAIARDAGIQTMCGLFDAETANIARGCIPNPDVIIARHVFGHVDDMKGFVKALDILANKDTLIVIEVPWAKRLLERCEFDTVYFEHLSYITIKSMEALLESTPFRLHRIHEFPVHGGALAIMIRRRDHESQPTASINEMLIQENVTESAWKAMGECARKRIIALKGFVWGAVAQGKTVCGYGASAKATVWLNALGFTRREIKFVTDTTPQKQWCTIPGRDIPVVDPGALIREQPDYCIVFAWNFFDECVSKEHLYREKGGQLLNPHELYESKTD